MVRATRRQVVFGIGALGAFGLSGPARSQQSYEIIDAFASGSLDGRIRFAGQVPKPREMRVSKNSAICGTGTRVQNPVEIGRNSALRNAVVAFDDIEAGKAWPMELALPRVIQRDCEFFPHVQIALSGTRIVVVNEDPLLHNIRGFERRGRMRRPMFMFSQPSAGQVDEAELSPNTGNVVELWCDAHSWMQAWIYTTNNPYLAVTNADGSFSIDGIPPGKHQVTVWHPVLGKKRTEVAINEQTTTEFDFDLSI